VTEPISDLRKSSRNANGEGIQVSESEIGVEISVEISTLPPAHAGPRTESSDESMSRVKKIACSAEWLFHRDVLKRFPERL